MSESKASFATPQTFLPSIQVQDPLAAYWLRQVTFRLRREIAWLWQQRLAHASENRNALPPFLDPLVEVLDLSRYDEEKARFFAENETCLYLSSKLQEAPPRPKGGKPIRGSFSWLVRELSMDDAGCFTLALALHPAIDSSAATVISSCLNNQAQQLPNLALAQRLWDDPMDFLDLLDTHHPVFRYGILRYPGQENHQALTWQTSLLCRPEISRCLIAHRPPTGAEALELITALQAAIPAPQVEIERMVATLRTPSDKRRIFPIRARDAEQARRTAAELSSRAGRRLARRQSSASDALAWLKGIDLICPMPQGCEHESPELPPPGLPVNVWLVLSPEAQLPEDLNATAPLELTAPDYPARLEQWRLVLGDQVDQQAREALPDIARRFRLDPTKIASIAGELCSLSRAVTAEDLSTACQRSVSLDLGGRATRVEPRFRMDELALPRTQQSQMEDIIGAVRSLTEVHYSWGTARPWSESGLSALFAGPPGTGKSMTAEVIAAECGLPLYRVDLSQVVNKYIGETEKNLRLIFDAADNTDICVVFDEADALFGKRSEVKDAHDRFANIEISYLLQRMETFRGVAILTSNRKKDLDEAFLRRLRFVVDFPMPEPAERLRLWQTMIPEGIDTGELDFPFLSGFPLAGGHIRSIVFAACLRAAHLEMKRKLTMPIVIHAIKREYDKLDRAIPTGQLGPYQEIFSSLLDQDQN